MRTFAVLGVLASVGCGPSRAPEPRPPAPALVSTPTGPPRPTVPPADRAAIERRWRVALGALAAGRAPEVDALEGCPTWPFPFPDDPARRVALGARWEEGGLRVPPADGEGNVRAMVGPPMPAMTGVDFRRAPSGEWKLCAFEAGD